MKKTIPLPKNKFLRILIFVILANIVIGIPLLAVGGARKTELVKSTLEAITCHNNQAWKQIVHPNCDEKIADLDQFLASLGESGIRITSDAERVRVYYFKEVSSFRGESKSVVDAHFTVEGEKYDLHLRYLKDEHGEGITSLSIEKIGNG